MALNPTARASVVMALIEHAREQDYESIAQRIDTLDSDERGEVLTVMTGCVMELITTMCPPPELVIQGLAEAIADAAIDEMEAGDASRGG